MSINIKRIYEPYSSKDGYRILIDRLWPRGMKKEDSHIDQWMKEVAPSTALRKWYNHDPAKWKEFCKKYHAEIDGSTALAELTAEVHKHKVVTLLYSSKETEYNNAVALQQFISVK